MKISRRDFLKSSFISIPLLPTIGGAVLGLMSFIVGKVHVYFEQRRKDRLIAEALKTPEGRTKLAQAMIEPIKRKMDYQGVGRKLLMVDDLSPEAMVRYEDKCIETANQIMDKHKGNTIQMTRVDKDIILSSKIISEKRA